MTNDQTPDDQLNTQIKDEMFRDRMRASDDPKAAKWVEKDESVQRKEARLDGYAQEIDKRKNMGETLHGTEQLLSEAQEARDAFLSQGRPGIFARKDREAFDTKSTELHSEVSQYQKQFVDMARKSSPEEIEALQVRMEKRQQELHATIKERQNIARLPSERASKQGQSQDGEAQERPLSMQDQIERSLNSWTPDTRLEGREKQEDLNFTRQLEADQMEMRKRLGRVPNNDEMMAYQAEREQQQVRQTQRAGQSQ